MPLATKSCANCSITRPSGYKPCAAKAPIPRPEVAHKLGISVTALKKNDMDKPLTTAEINQLLQEQPEWLQQARATMAQARGHEVKD